MAAPLMEVFKFINNFPKSSTKTLLQPLLCTKAKAHESVTTSYSSLRKKDVIFCNQVVKSCKVGTFSTGKLHNHLHSVYKSNARLYSTTSLEDRKCWKCGSETNTQEELFFCNCGVVQDVPSDLNYFVALGFERGFDIDLGQLSKLYKDLQKRLHPDKYSQKSEKEQDVADRQSAYINKAYTTLLRPLSRSLYLLELHGDPIDEANTLVDSEFLILMMEINEELSEHQHDIDIVKKLQKENARSTENCITSISEAFESKDIAEAKKLVVKLKYYTNIEEKIKEILRHKMD